MEKNTPCPKVKMEIIVKPYECGYQDRCKSELPKEKITSYTILPHVSNELKEFMDEKGLTDLQKVPDHFSLKEKDIEMIFIK